MLGTILSGITSFIGGKAFDNVVDTAMKYLPPSMSELEKKEFELKIKTAANEQQKEANRVLSEAANQLDKRIAEQEGTAKDLLAMPILGRIVLFLRGLQRPVWGFATLYLDFYWLTSGNTFTDQQNTGLIVINMLVLGFLFGERTIKNLEPLIIKIFAKN